MQHLAELIRVVNSVNPATLDMDTWKCGSHACMGGQLALDPYFQALGLGFLDIEQGGRTHTYVSLQGVDYDPQEFGYKHAYDSLAQLFGITFDEALGLFDSVDSYERWPDGKEENGLDELDVFKSRLTRYLGYNPWAK